MNNLLENLNKEQYEAVSHGDGPVLIVAGAGTGKTMVITQRIAYLIEQGKAKSDEILALTFTEKAAGEMEERVDRLLPMGYLDLWISTFHSFGERILKEHGLEIGLPAGAKLLNEFEQWALIQKNLDKFNLDYYRPLGNPTKFIHALVKHFSRLKDEDISPADYLKYAEELRQNQDDMLSGVKKSKIKSQKSKLQLKSQKLSHEKDLPGENEIKMQEASRISEVANAYHVYQQLLLDNNALDFGDLINFTLKLFRTRPGVLAKYRQQFKYILLDEFQDTNWAQYELIKLLVAPRNPSNGRAGNLMVVGDDDQSVYKFRGASVSNILQFKKDFPNAKEIFLVNNYRNTQNILDLSYNFIQLNNPNRLEYQLKSQKSKVKSQKLLKKLIANNKNKGNIEIIQGADLQDEIRQVVEKIADLKIAGKDTNWSDFAVLVRANDSAREICASLDESGLPYQFMASRGLYAKPVIMDLTAYLKLLDDYHESVALFRVLNLPIFDFTHKELVDLNYVARKKSWSLYTVLKDAAGKFGADCQTKIDRVLGLIEKHSALARQKSVLEVALAFMADSGYLEFLTKLEEGESREQLYYLNRFANRMQKFTAASDDKSVKAFLAEYGLELESGEQGALPGSREQDAGPDTIKIMTVHAAKGLEFKHVFITNMVDKRFPTIERNEPIAIPDPLVKEILPEGDIHLEEERRLFYVAMTRAKEGLYFSWALDYGGARLKKPSRFLEEVGILKDSFPNKEMAISKSEFLISKQIPNSKPQTPVNLSYNPPSYFSYSQLAAFSSCPYQYRFAHILKIPVRGKAVFSFGKTMHSAMQKLFQLAEEKKGLGQTNLFGEKTAEKKTAASSKAAPKILDSELKDIFEQSWIDEWYDSSAQKEQYRKLGIRILKEFFDKHKDNWPNTINLEKGFNFKVGSGGTLYTVKGVIDRIDETRDGIKIIDYKTGGVKEKLGFEEKEQLLIYQLAVADLYPRPVSSLAYYYLEKNEEIEFTATGDELEKIRTKIIDTINDIRKGEFPPRPSMLCSYCDFKDICEFRKI